MAASKSDEQYILTLLDKASRHEASEAELRYLDLWYDSFQEAPLYTDGMSPEEEEQAMSMLFDRIHNQIEQRIQEDISIKSIPIYKRILPFLKYAAAILLFLALPLYFFRDSLPPAVTELKLVQEVSDVLKKQNPLTISDEFAKEIQLVLSEDRRVNLPEGDVPDYINAEKYINVLHSDNQITYTVKDSLSQIAPQNPIYHIVRIPYGKRLSVTLIDGTKVSLNSGTELKYPINVQNEQMDLYLTGEAYFDVAKSQNRKFNVHVRGNREKKAHMVQVLGTQFNIRAFPNDKQSVTTLFEGAIQLSGLDRIPIPLQPLKQIAVGQTYAITNADMEGASAWRNNLFYFKNTPLEEVAIELERWYGVKIQYRKTTKSKKLLAQISREKSLEQVLEMLAQTYDIKYEYQGKEVVLSD
ncbi:FecR family protein [Sphingobacterium yanglingense]|nr:FecR family protein [Sphingobacterium yanglingense]